MYHDYYKLAGPPFENTPDPRYFFASEQHREALAAIEYTIRMRKGFVLITGDIGSGKTTVGRTVCQRCADQALIIQVMHSHLEGSSLLRQVLRALHVKHQRQDDHGQLLEALRDKLLEQIDEKKPVVLLVDEAQTLSDEALEELRLMSNFDCNNLKLIQIVLIGQPELRQRLRSVRLSALRQRITLAKQLKPLTARETTQYIAHRLGAASLDPQQVHVRFDDEAIALIQQTTGGVPRLVNVTCDNCLLMAYVRQTDTITAAMVRRGLQDMVPNFNDSLDAGAAADASLNLAA